VLVAEAAGVLSALGLAVGDERRDRVRTFLCDVGEAGPLPASGEADLRYEGQSFELTVPLGGDLVGAFHDAHEQRYGYADRDRPVELVAVRTADVTPGPRVELGAARPLRVRGPEVVELDGATCWVPAGWSGATDAHGTLVLERAA
jgi:N-methylhydantoinase A